MYILHLLWTVLIRVLLAYFVYLIVWLDGNSMEVKTGADSNDIITECSHDDKPTVGMFGNHLL